MRAGLRVVAWICSTLVALMLIVAYPASGQAVNATLLGTVPWRIRQCGPDLP